MDDRVDATPAMCRSLRRDGSKRSTQREPVVEAMGQTLDDRLLCLVASHRRGGWRSASEPLVQAMGLTLDERVQQVEPIRRHLEEGIHRRSEDGRHAVCKQLL